MTIAGTITDARVQHCNGDDTAKEMLIDCVTVHEDGDGAFEYPDQFTIPVAWSTQLGDVTKYKTITIILE